MTTRKTYDLDFYCTEGFTGAPPDVIRVTVSRDDVAKWLELARLIDSEGLERIEKCDDRCEFFYDEVELSALRTMGEVLFYPCFKRFDLLPDVIVFKGSLSHSEQEWSAAHLALETLANDFGLHFQPPAPTNCPALNGVPF